MTALHRLNKNCGEIVCIVANPFKRLGSSILEHHNIGSFFAWNAGCGWDRVRNAALLESLHEHFVEHSVVVTGEEHHFVAAGDGAGHAHGCDYRFGTRVAEGGALVTRELANHFRDFASQQSLRADFEAFMKLFFDRPFDEIRAMAEHDWAEAVENVNVLVSVDVPEVRTLRPHGDDRIDHFLPL